MDTDLVVVSMKTSSEPLSGPVLGTPYGSGVTGDLSEMVGPHSQGAARKKGFGEGYQRAENLALASHTVGGRLRQLRPETGTPGTLMAGYGQD